MSATHLERIHTILQQLETATLELDNRSDRRATFTYAYARMTYEVARRFEEMPFRHPEFVVVLVEDFAAVYLSAIQHYDRDRANSPEIWQTAFDLFNDKKTSVVEELLISMYVHIACDLPYVLLGIQKKLPEINVHDFHLVNNILESIIAEVQIILTSRYSKRLLYFDKLFRSQDELLTNYGIRLSRGMAWYNFQRLLAGEDLSQSLFKTMKKHTNSILEGPVKSLKFAIGLVRYFLNATRKWPATGTAIVYE